MGIARLPPDRAPAADRMSGTEVRPFRQVGLRQDDHTRIAEAADQRCIAARYIVLERQGSGRRVHVVGGIDVVLHQDDQPMYRSSRMTRRAFGVERARLIEGMTVEFDHGVQRGPPGIAAGDGLTVEFDPRR